MHSRVLDKLSNEEQDIFRYINFKLKMLGFNGVDVKTFESGCLENYLEDQFKSIILENKRPPIDQRICQYLKDQFSSEAEDLSLPISSNIFELDQKGIGRILSVPVDSNTFKSDLVESYRVMQGVLHNTRNDRRTTKGVFHVSEGGLPISSDKITVPKHTFAKLFQKALQPPEKDLTLPVTSNQKNSPKSFVGLTLRPLVSPKVAGKKIEKRMEIRMLAPGSLVANLDFVESIFGNAGNPFLPENDAYLDVESFSGHTGFILLAPHLNLVTKKEVGLPHYDEATPLQKKQGMCWQKEDEIYNDGEAFKICYRTSDGFILTIIADNYFGYCKKEVKTQITFACNLMGNAEEEHAGGALTYPRYNLGERFEGNRLKHILGDYSFEDLLKNFPDHLKMLDGYAIDKKYPQLVYLPENFKIKVQKLEVSWSYKENNYTQKLSPNKIYVHPSGYRVHLEKHSVSNIWYLVGTLPESMFCHKPATVSGGGKSEISKSIANIIIYKSFFVNNLYKDLETAETIINRNYGDRFIDKSLHKGEHSRPILSKERSLGSVIKLLTYSNEYTHEYNKWLGTIPPAIKNLVYIVKRFYHPKWGNNWKQFFNVDVHDGLPGYVLKYKQQDLSVKYLRVGTDKNSSWRTFRLRQDFMPAAKIQMEDDITVSTVFIPKELSGMPKDSTSKSYKFTQNCENHLFQRPDEAIFRGIDAQTEKDFSGRDLFLANYEPLKKENAQDILEEVIEYDKFSDPMKEVIKEATLMEDDQFFVSTTHPRIVNGAPTKNMRYLQKRQDLSDEFASYVTNICTQMTRRQKQNSPVLHPVDAVLFGRRNNKSDQKLGIKALSVYNPIHYQELPELFLDFLASLSGKSPSTTGFGSEGALTKGPFNSLRLITDLNDALVSYILTANGGFSTAAGFVGDEFKVDHDITFLVPEVWSRMSRAEIQPQYLIENGYLDRIEDLTFHGMNIKASRLGYRINEKFVNHFMGRIFAAPDTLFDQKILRPETQDLGTFAEGVEYICDSQKRVAKGYFDDGSIDIACPPLKVLLHIALHDEYEGMTIDSKEFRNMFTLDTLLKSEWYQRRLEHKQKKDIAHYEKMERYISSKLENTHNETHDQALKQKLQRLKEIKDSCTSPQYLKDLHGTIGADPKV